MSKKKNKKKNENTQPELKLIEPPKPASPSKKEQLAKMLFNDFFKKTMKVFGFFDNGHISITPYVEVGAEEKNDGTDICCYEITPASNQDVMVFLDEEDIYVSLQGVTVELNDDELGYLVQNIMTYMKKYGSETA